MKRLKLVTVFLINITIRPWVNVRYKHRSKKWKRIINAADSCYYKFTINYSLNINKGEFLSSNSAS
jgi:hypothetical protein